MKSDKSDTRIGQRSGQALFAIAFLLLSVLLLSQIGDQTKWVRKTKFFAQPRFWPAVGLGGMVLFGALHLLRLPQWRIERADWREGGVWLQSVEFVLWFMAYVWLVPLAGYLPVTLVFVPALLWRMGYRDRRLLWSGAGIGLITVVLFKSLLDVKIPGAALYEYLPGTLRSFFILNF
jgi:hypothetical protein